MSKKDKKKAKKKPAKREYEEVGLILPKVKVKKAYKQCVTKA